MTPVELLAELSSIGIKVTAPEGRLRVNAPKGVLTKDLLERITAHKPEILSFLALASQSAKRSAVVPLNPDGARQPFFGIPGHVGDVFCFVRLAAELGPDQPFFALEPPGLRGECSPLESIGELAAYHVLELTRYAPRGPYLLGGYCFGGVIAFETARLLQEQDKEVALLMLMGTTCPTAFQLKNRVVRSARWGLRRVRHHLAASSKRGLGGRFRYAAERLGNQIRRTREAAPPPSEHLRNRQAVGVATAKAARRYVPRRFRGRLTLVLPSEASRYANTRHQLDWARFADECELLVGPDGNRIDRMLRDPYVRATAELIEPCLARADAGARTASN